MHHPEAHRNLSVYNVEQLHGLNCALSAVAQMITRTSVNEAMQPNVRAQRTAILDIARKLIEAERDTVLAEAVRYFRAYEKSPK